MKTIKIWFACFFAVSIGIAVSAFTQQAEKPTPTVFNNWYEFTGNPSVLAQVQDEAYYVYSSTQPTCEDGEVVCSINVPGPAVANQHPSTFTETIEDDLEIAFEGGAVESYILMKD